MSHTAPLNHDDDHQDLIEDRYDETEVSQDRTARADKGQGWVGKGLLAGALSGAGLGAILIGLTLNAVMALDGNTVGGILTFLAFVVLGLLLMSFGTLNRRRVAAPEGEISASMAEMAVLVLIALGLYLSAPDAVLPALGTAVGGLGAMILASSLVERSIGGAWARGIGVIAGSILIFTAPMSTWFIPVLFIGAAIGILSGLTSHRSLRRHQPGYYAVDAD